MGRPADEQVVDLRGRRAVFERRRELREQVRIADGLEQAEADLPGGKRVAAADAIVVGPSDREARDGDGRRLFECHGPLLRGGAHPNAAQQRAPKRTAHRSSELWVARALNQPRPFGGGGVGLNDGEGGSGNRDGYIGTCSGIAIAGDGTGPDIWRAARRVFDATVQKVSGGKRQIDWLEVLAGEKAFKQVGNWLPDATLDAIRTHRVAIKGPLTTPVGGGIRSLNVALRQVLDLYACVRPVRYFRGVPSPMKAPEKLDVVIFRENVEDVYAGIEYQA